MAEGEEQIIEGGGNVFADLGMRDADELLVCAELSHLIHAELRDRHITPFDAARLLGIDEDVAAQLMAGRFVRLSTERLLHLLSDWIETWTSLCGLGWPDRCARSFEL